VLQGSAPQLARCCIAVSEIASNQSVLKSNMQSQRKVAVLPDRLCRLTTQQLSTETLEKQRSSEKFGRLLTPRVN